MDRENHIYIRKIIVYAVIVAFFAGIIFAYYRMVYNEKRENIINRGRINAVTSSGRINTYLLSSVDILKLSSYMLDNMLREERSNEEMLDYLTNETVAVGNSLISNTTGIYGYINGQYMDGSGWVPDEGYIPTERPWYTEGKKGGGELVLVDPYIDLDTGGVMIAVSRTLCDDVSVVGIDLPMDELQGIIEEHLSDNRFYEEFIINKAGYVVAHSDPGIVGLYYTDPVNPLGEEISDAMQSSDNNFFYLEGKNSSYMVYIMPLSYDWSYITVIDATAEFSALRIPFIIAILAALILTGILIFFMVRADIKSREAAEFALQSEMAAAASEAKTVFMMNISHEIRTPINTIRGMNEMVLREEKDENILEYSRNIRTAVARLLEFVDELLSFTMADTDNKDRIVRQEDGGSFDNTPDIAGCGGYRERFTAPSARVLYVDDNPMNLVVFKNLVRDTQIQVDTADSGSEGIKLTEAFTYDLLFFDHMMPEMDGIETLGLLRAEGDNQNRNVPAVCLTANAIPGAREYYLESGFDDYMSKPVDAGALEDLLIRMLPDEKIIMCTEDTADDSRGDAKEEEPLPEELLALRKGSLDVSYAVKNCGSSAGYMSLLKMFYESIDSNANEIDSLYENSDIRNYTIKVHALKSSARLVGAMALGDEAQRIEDAGKSGDDSYISDHHAGFIQQYRSFKEILSHVFGAAKEEDASQKPEIQRDMLVLALEEIKEAADEIDSDRLDQVIERLDRYRLEPDIEEYFKKIKEAASGFEYDEILETILRIEEVLS